MRKSLFFTAIAALAAFASCQKEDLTDNYTVKDPVFTATIENSGTKTTVDAANGKVAWVNGDEITITDVNSNSVKYEVSNIDAQGRATFIKQASETKSLGVGPYTAVYGVAPITSQTYSTTAPSLPMSASSQTTSLNFEVTCGLLEITLTKADETIKIIDVSDGTNTYTLVCPNVSIASATKFYIAVPKATYTSFIFTNQSNKTCVKNSLSIEVVANHIKPVSSTNLTFSVDKLRGEFSVNSSGTKVCFSPGNLYYDKSVWGKEFFAFEANQYDYQSSWIGSRISLFYYSNSMPVAYAENYSSTSEATWNILFSNHANYQDQPNANFTVAGQKGVWRTLTYDEWTYLISSRTDTAKKFGYAKVAGKNGIIILPDTFIDPMKNDGSGAFVPSTTTDWSANVYTVGGNWEAMESAGAVFLPAAGKRSGSNVSDGDVFGYYWSSTPHSSAKYAAGGLSFDISFSASVGYCNRNIGSSVRLVQTVPTE